MNYNFQKRYETLSIFMSSFIDISPPFTAHFQNVWKTILIEQLLFSSPTKNFLVLSL